MSEVKFNKEGPKHIAELLKLTRKATFEVASIVDDCIIDKDVYDKVEPERRHMFRCCSILDALDYLENDDTIEINIDRKPDKVIITTEVKQ